MIFYDYMNERWEDTEDKNFAISMTPEGDSEELEKEFETQSEFYKWYYGK